MEVDSKIGHVEPEFLLLHISSSNLHSILSCLMTHICMYLQSLVSLQGLLEELVANCDGQLKAEVVQSAAHFEHRLQLGQKAIYHLEAFIAKFMAIYKRFLEEGIADLF